jgi:hypothetical protein
VQSVKTLVARLWTPDVSRTMRAEAAELIRRKSLNPAGLEEIRHIAGLGDVSLSCHDWGVYLGTGIMHRLNTGDTHQPSTDS